MAAQIANVVDEARRFVATVLAPAAVVPDGPVATMRGRSERPGHRDIAVRDGHTAWTARHQAAAR